MSVVQHCYKSQAPHQEIDQADDYVSMSTYSSSVKTHLWAHIVAYLMCHGDMGHTGWHILPIVEDGYYPRIQTLKAATELLQQTREALINNCERLLGGGGKATMKVFIHSLKIPGNM